ncbi:alpha-amylase family glycosyl hydrolase [Aliiroseovarius subalbicans]|uniref:alpha-amylase family glycosyl hydrolase n=1 Tax=Aliiroseovarius subalbicans TaxID=2925840 RepID=UPI001F55ABB1|nr:alpha-amylase family glycosyl hydrolase [Aliiroseovarius subalbicans]MCI2398503.1 alpha-amylase family glycosyl hydrolase [Aliiroseovarius subalbicans]
MNASTGIGSMTHLAKDPDWWRGAVIYQIYPRSFQDANGDGIGDLLGIVRRLPYVASLGVDAIWISPFFTSPMKDFGYDVSDYCDVDPMFGSLADFDAVIETAHALGVKVMIDLVLSHTSDQHPWFAESRASRENAKSNWYVWADAKPDGTPPTNWLSIFGGSGWQWDTRRQQYYMHNFLVEQPDLNFHDAEVQQALLDVARFWLNRGVDGFRLDTINFYTHDAQLRDNPALAPEDRNSTIAPAVNPYNHQDHKYDKNRPETLEFLRKLRAVMQPFNAAAVGEVGEAQRGLEIMGEYTAGNDLMQMCYAFEMLSGAQPVAGYVAEVMARVAEVAADGWACWAYSNHDVQRHVSRWNLTDPAARMFTTLMMCLRGSACLYQGEELGLPEAEVAFADLQDPYGIEFWPEFKGRDGCRTPMVWEKSNQNGGFSTAARPWLPVSGDHLGRAVEAAEADPAALVHHYRRAIAFRHAQPALARGEMTDMRVEGDVLSFLRSHGDDVIFCAFNMGEGNAVIDAPKGDWQAIGAELNGAHADASGKIHLAHWQPCLLRRA